MSDVFNGKDFDAWRAAKLGAPIKFKLAGEIFEVPRAFSSAGSFVYLRKIRELASRIGDGSGSAVEELEDNLNWAFLKENLPETIFNHFYEVCHKNAIDAATITAICQHIVEEVTGRPFVSFSDSTRSSSPNGQALKDDSSSEESQLTTSQREKPTQSPTRSVQRTSAKRRRTTSTRG